MSDNYWELTQYDGTITDIPPEAVDTVKRRWDAGEPIHTSGGSISAKDIKSFTPTTKRKDTVPLLDGAAQAFNEPVFNADGSVQSAWVKKPVPSRIYAKQFAGIPAYKVLASDAGMVTVAFRLPVHTIDTATLNYCTEAESQQLTQRSK